jgi:hypothetical protein
MADNGRGEYLNDWRADCDHMPGPGRDRDLRVGGTIRFRTDGWTAELTPTEGNTGSNQLMLHLDLVVTAPDGPVNRVITDVPVEWHDESPAFDYDEVEFHRADADPPPRMKIQHLERPEAGS